MQKAKVDILLVTFAYGGNGGVSSMIPELAQWTTKTVIAMKGDERIGRIKPITLSDTPITMTRNRAVRIAKEEGFDLILMLDNDNEPDGYYPYDPSAKPFWEVAFPFVYDRLMKGEPTVIAAPYCGPPPHPVFESSGEVPYLFEFMNNESDEENPQYKLELLTRNEAARLRGIHPVAALPTGVCLFSTNIFDGPPKPYFAYEWNEDHSEKQSTEDVYCTRNLGIYWAAKKSLQVVFAACDSWALHYKPKKVGRPCCTPVEAYAKNMRKALTEDPVSTMEGKLHVDYTADLPLGDGSSDYLSFAQPEASTEVVSQEPQPEIPEEVVAEALKLDHDDRHKGNGKPTFRYNRIGGKKVAIHDDFEIDVKTAENITTMANWLVEQVDGSPRDVMVIHAGSGQGSAAILAALPEGSHLYALDCTTVHGWDDTPGLEFGKTFAKELETGRVRAQLAGRKFPWPDEPEQLNLVFIERFHTAEKFLKAAENVAFNGLLAGLGYESSKVRKMVDGFADERGLPLKVEGDLWVIQMGLTVSHKL